MKHIAVACVALSSLASAGVGLADPAAPPSPTVSVSTSADTEEPAVDVHVSGELVPWRRFTIEWNPLPFILLGKLSANVVIVPKEHHALVLSPFFTDNTTSPIDVYNDGGQAMQLPEQKFVGLGLEVGYRYYWGHRGPRGLFVGPSLILEWMHESQEMYGNGSHTNYGDFGLAFDIGYQMLVTKAITLSVGAGIQGTLTSQTIPQQQFPVDVYGNSGIWPRLLFSGGYAF